MTFETQPGSTIMSAEDLSAKSATLQAEIAALELQLEEGGSRLSSELEDPRLAAVESKIRAGIHLEIVKKQAELTSIEKDLAAITYGSPKLDKLSSSVDTSYDMYEKQFRSLPLEQLKEERKKLDALLQNLHHEEEGTQQLLSTHFSKETEARFRVNDLQQKINIIDRLITQAEKYDVNSDPWAHVEERYRG